MDLKCNLTKKPIAFKKGGKLKNNEIWHMEGQKMEVVSEIIYIGEKLEITGAGQDKK